MFSSVGADVIYLKRLSMGALALDPDLAPGDYRRLTPDEQAALGI
jgi:16S rRNA pseudouridine516 synthase